MTVNIGGNFYMQNNHTKYFPSNIYFGPFTIESNVLYFTDKVIRPISRAFYESYHSFGSMSHNKNST